MTIGQNLRNKAMKSREELARAEFSKEAILKACNARAAEGFTWCEIRPSKAIDVQRTEAVAAMKEELSGEQLRLEWQPVREQPDTPPYTVLRVSWEAKNP
ncbi:hypothetical protein [Ensifer soli]|uniref:hypothetical protein n=1 Tax=Ciceribacter sp. sgz301302 TaxID=3342379 RepID=UPI0035B99A3F